MNPVGRWQSIADTGRRFMCRGVYVCTAGDPVKEGTALPIRRLGGYNVVHGELQNGRPHLLFL